MLVNQRTVELTQSFYEWELRGRGWARYPYRVPLEPPFVSVGSQRVSAPPAVDDGRRETWLSTVVSDLRRGLLGGDDSPATALSPTEGEAAAEPEIDDRQTSFREYVVALPGESRVSAAHLSQWMGTLVSVRHPLAVEVLGGRNRVEVRVAVAESEVEPVLGQLKATLPELVVQEAETLATRWSESGAAFAAVEFGLSREFMVPLGQGAGDEPLLPIVAALAGLGEKELGLYQVILEPTRKPWARSVLHAVQTPSGEPFFADAPEVTKFAAEKVSEPLFAVALRVAGSSTTVERSIEILRRVAAGLSQFGDATRNEFMPLPTEDLQTLEEDLLARTTHRSGMLLSSAELARLIQLPGAGVQLDQFHRADLRTRRAPGEVLGSGCLLGVNEHEGTATQVRLTAGTRMKHVHLVGGSGTGKSTLMAQMILEDVEAGHGVGLIDPHGDLVTEIAGRLPKSRIDDVVWFDPSDTDRVVGWNILGARDDVERDLLASDLVSVFRRLSTSWGDQMTAVLANAILVFLESPRGGTGKVERGRDLAGPWRRSETGGLNRGVDRRFSSRRGWAGRWRAVAAADSRSLAGPVGGQLG